MTGKIKVLITKADPMKWYHHLIGQSIEVLEELIDNKYHYDEYHMIEPCDCLSNVELREKKLERIVN